MTWDAGLNDEQRRAVGATNRNAAVIAGPGTGKSRTLLSKARQLIEEELATPDRIRVANFTNAGVFELRKRLLTMADGALLAPDAITTFHSLALRTLRAVGDKSIPTPLVMLDDWEEHTFVDRLATIELGLRSVDAARKLREDYNSRWCIASNDAAAWHSEGRRRDFERVYGLARDLLGFTTRGELTFLWWRHLSGQPNASIPDLAIPWTHLLTDEYQDLNECEHEILQLLSSAGVSVFAVGDPNQSIYETMRHAHPEFCWNLPERLGGGALHELTRSYRCPAEILALGRALLGKNDGVPDPELAVPGSDIHFLSFPSDQAERSGIARIAGHILQQQPTARVLLAVPSRAMAASYAGEMGAQCDDRTQRADGPSEACRLAKALLRLRQSRRDSVAAATALVLLCGRTTRAKRVSELLAAGRASSSRVADLLFSASPLPPALSKARIAVREMLESLDASTNPSLTLRDLTGCARTESTLEELQAAVEDSHNDEEQLAPGKITIMTLHGSKGTEAEWVLIPAVEPGYFERDLVGAAKEERRRLLYVGITRSLHGVLMTFCARRYGPDRYSDPIGPSARKGQSEFINEMCERSGRAIESGTTYVKELLG